MRFLKINSLFRLLNSYLIDASQPSTISYLWNFGSLLAVCLIIQIVTGITLAMHYSPNVLEAFNSIEHIMRDVNNGWLVRYLHSNTASAFFFLVYLHVGRGIYYGSYRAPRTLVWVIGTVILIAMMATAFLGYVLPYGQMSLWGATVITNLISAIPWIGQDIVEFIWGGFSVNNATLNRFFSLHFVLPFVLAALVLMHLIALHDKAGSSNPLGISGTYDRITFAPYYLFKDLITIFMLVIGLSVFVFLMPNVLGDSENYIMANPMQTPSAIVPEWYLLPFYAILRSIPNKLLGVIAMFSAIVIILTLPFTDLSKLKGLSFKPFGKFIFWVFVFNFFILMQLGAKHVESPFIELGQSSTILYFIYFILIIPFSSVLENTYSDLRKSSFSYSDTYIPYSSLTAGNTSNAAAGAAAAGAAASTTVSSTESGLSEPITAAILLITVIIATLSVIKRNIDSDITQELDQSSNTTASLANVVEDNLSSTPIIASSTETPSDIVQNNLPAQFTELKTLATNIESQMQDTIKINLSLADSGRLMPELSDHVPKIKELENSFNLLDHILVDLIKSPNFHNLSNASEISNFYYTTLEPMMHVYTDNSMIYLQLLGNYVVQFAS